METKKQRIIFLEGKKVVLRPLNKKTDLENVTKWINDREVVQYLQAFLPKTFQEEKEWLSRKNDEKNIVLAIETTKGIHIGSLGLHNIDSIHRVVTFGIMIGEKEYWGKRYGTEALMLLLEYAFNTLNLRKVCLDVFAFNNRAKKVYEKCGFKKEGVMKEHHYVNGKYIDVVFMAVFKKDFLKIWEKYLTSEVEPR